MLASVPGPTSSDCPAPCASSRCSTPPCAVFSRRGFHAASMDEIAERAGISKPMVYAYLGTKEELFLACLHREGTRLMAGHRRRVGRPTCRRTSSSGAACRASSVRRRAPGRLVGALPAGRGGSRSPASWPRCAARMVEVVAGMLDRRCAAEGREVAASDLDVVRLRPGRRERVAGRLARDHPEADPEKTATRLMNVVWMGAGQLLLGQTWRPPAH